MQAVGIDTAELPPLDHFAFFRDPDGIRARAVGFVGVRPRREFSYSDIRRFGYLALGSVATAIPDAREIAVTLHGVGYGLDEVECVEAELAGVMEAAARRHVPRGLRTITFLENDEGRADRLRGHLAGLLGSARKLVPGLEAEWMRTGAEGSRVARAGTLEAQRGHALVAMPFDDAFDDLFHYGLTSAVRDAGLLCERVDKDPFTGDIVERLKDRIRTARLVIADVTDANANVFLEVGFAWGLGIPTVLICREDSRLAFDVQNQRCIFYNSIRDIETKLSAELKGLLPTRS